MEQMRNQGNSILFSIHTNFEVPLLRLPLNVETHKLTKNSVSICHRVGMS